MSCFRLVQIAPKILILPKIDICFYFLAAEVSWVRSNACTVDAEIMQYNNDVHQETMKSLIEKSKEKCAQLSNCLGFSAIQNYDMERTVLMSAGSFQYDSSLADRNSWCWKKVMKVSVVGNKIYIFFYEVRV